MNDPESVGCFIRKLRRDVLNISQEKFAELADISPDTVSNIECGKYYMKIPTLGKIAESCGVSSDDILGIVKPDD